MCNQLISYSPAEPLTVTCDSKNSKSSKAIIFKTTCQQKQLVEENHTVNHEAASLAAEFLFVLQTAPVDSEVSLYL